MKPSLESPEEYEKYIYALPSIYSQLEKSTLVFIRTGRYFAKIKGTIFFKGGIELQVFQFVDFGVSRILRYSYAVFRNQKKQYWYDPQPHPHVPALASTHPHHKHIQPDIKHNRIPAPNLSFEYPNLPFLIDEIISEFFTSPQSPTTPPESF